jgi:hypothetical protein
VALGSSGLGTSARSFQWLVFPFQRWIFFLKQLTNHMGGMSHSKPSAIPYTVESGVFIMVFILCIV